jgi:hypothetical protein
LNKRESAIIFCRSSAIDSGELALDLRYKNYQVYASKHFLEGGENTEEVPLVVDLLVPSIPVKGRSELTTNGKI